MVQLSQSLLVGLGLAGLASIAAAHPGHNVEIEAAERAAFLKSVPVQGRSLGHCAAKLKARGIAESNAVRRENAVQQLRKRAGNTDGRYLKVRDLDSVLATDHESTKTSPSRPTRASCLQTAGLASCSQKLLKGHTVHIAGELVRRNVAEDQAGVPLFLDLQLIDVNTCEPLKNVYTDIWHCNATGVYSGVVANGNGNSDDESNSNTTFLRGIQSSGSDGVVQFESIFPGHYTGRAVHIHVVTHPGDQIEVLPNNTLAGLYDTRASHVGQIFFDQDLIAAVEKTSPYNANTQTLLNNSDDSILATEAETTDPFVEYVLLGDDVSQGVFAWISLGINSTRNEYNSPEGYWTEDGAEVNPNFSMNIPGMGDLQIPTGSSAVLSQLPRQQLRLALTITAPEIRHIDVLVANAGFATPMTPALSTSASDLRASFEVNTIAPLLVFQAFWPLLKKAQSGTPKAIFMSSSVGSIGAQEPFPSGAYGPSRAAGNWLTRALHLQHEADGLVAVALHPGWVKTRAGEFVAKEWGFDAGPPETVEKSVKGILEVVDMATRESVGGRFVTYEGMELPW
ncbi:Intradiol ring-cleavage dioxygenase [Aspergillus spinulosporus]